MKPVMRVDVLQRSDGGFEGHVRLPNLASTLLMKENKSRRYSTVANLRQAATAAAKKYRAELHFVVPTKIAAKKATN